LEKPTNSTASPYWDFEHADYTAINAYSRLSINFDFSLGMLDIGRHYPLIPFPNSTSLSYPAANLFLSLLKKNPSRTSERAIAGPDGVRLQNGFLVL